MKYLRATWTFIRRRPLTSGACGIVTLLLLVIIGARLWINSDGGRAFVLSQIDGREIGSLGTISAEGLTGDPLNRMHLNHLSIADSEGVWLEANDIRLNWTPRALLSRKVELKLASAGDISVLRRPQTTASESAGGGSWSVELEDLYIGKLSLAEGVAGPEATFSVSGAFTRGKDSILTANLNITPIEGLGDRFMISAQRDAAGQFNLNADGEAPAGGTFATLLHLEDGQSASLTASVDGTIEEGDGYVQFQVSGEDAASMTAKILDGRLTANADVNALSLPLPETVQELLGSQARFVLGADIKKNVASFDLSASMASGVLTAKGEADTETKRLNGPAAVTLKFTGLPDLAGVDANLTLDGTLEMEGDVPSYTGQANLVALKGADLPFRQLTGPVTVSVQTDNIPFRADLVGEGVFAGNDTVSGLLGKQPHLVASGTYARDTGVLTLAPSALTLPDGKVSASGTIAAEARTLDIRGTLDQALRSLPGSFGGRAAGTFRVHGQLTSPSIDTNLTGEGFSGLPDSVQPLIGPAPKVNASLKIDGKAIRIAKATLASAGLQMNGNGTYRIGGKSALAFDFDQTAPLDISGNAFNLGSGQIGLVGPSDALVVDFKSTGGSFRVASRDIEDVTATTTLSLAGDRIAGPVRVTGTAAGEELDLTADFARANGGILIENINGNYGPLALAGRTEISPAGDLIVAINADGDGLTTEDIRVKSLRANASIVKEGDAPMSLVVHAEGTDAKLKNGVQLDDFSADIKNNKDGYDFRATLLSTQPSFPFDFTFSGKADLSGDAPEGTFSLSGTALGEKLSTPQPARWRLGDAPDLNGQLDLLGGEIKASLSGSGETATLALDVNAVDFGALFTLANLGDVDARLNGHGEFKPIGLSPSGSFAFSATSPVPGLDTSLSLDMTGKLNAKVFKLNARSNYGKDLVLVSDAALPVKPSANSLVSLDREQPLSGQASLKGDLAALQSAALAYGHDIGGRIDALATVKGSFAEPAYQAKATISNGLYEYGATGMRVTGIAFDAAYADQTITVKGTGQGAGNGSVSINGSLGKSQGRVEADLTRLLVYDRDGDIARLSGKVTLTEDDDGRLAAGKLVVDEARVSLDNLPSSGPKAIDVRWTDDDVSASEASRMKQTLRLNLDINADRRIYVTGRGLDSEWAIDLTATGTASNVNLKGDATMVRGSLDLAGRPFVFDSGEITFDGPVDSARIAVDAERSVNGFVARVQVSGKPSNPVFELSSTPDLPQDEILSRLLFGRSSIDLSPVEAAQLASSIAKLSGRGGGFDPAAQLQSALRVDRLSIGSNDAGNAELGVGQYLSDDVYLQLNAAGASGSSVEVEWEPADHVSVTSETTATGENKISIRWKKDY
ncbi:MAG: translocation/assembly module TamB domain-containing protein [Alphaproteobacteria bacterium]|nr:translocation/assembly module TamB domain-containing protein [Alphaproteobacteria bacterium]